LVKGASDSDSEARDWILHDERSDAIAVVGQPRVQIPGS